MVFLVGQIGSPGPARLRMQGWLLEFEPHLTSDISKGQGFFPASRDKKPFYEPTCVGRSTQLLLLRFLPVLEFVYRVIRIEVHTEIQVEWFVLLERHC